MQHPYYALLLLVSLGGVLHGHAHPTAESTPAGKFWQQALPGSPMPEAIAQLVEKGIHRSPLEPNNPVSVEESLGRWECYLFYSSSCEKLALPPPGLFFREGEARVGATMEVHLPATRALPGLLSREAAARAPSPFDDMAAVLTRFGVTPGSEQAAMIKNTLDACTEEQPMHGEQMACATSLEATVVAAMRMLQATTDDATSVWATASALPEDGLPRQLYEVTAVDALDGDRHVVCHALAFPYTVYRCHMTSATRALVVKLRGLRRIDGPEVAVVAICHLDTSNWFPDHLAFKVLDTKPGATPVCHFIPYSHLVFGEKKKPQASAGMLMGRSMELLQAAAAAALV